MADSVMRTSRKCVLAILVCLFAAILTAGEAKAGEAPEIIPEGYSSEVSGSMLPYLFDRSYCTIWYAKRGWIQIELPENQPAHMLYICFYRQAVPVTIQVPDGSGGYRDEVMVDDPYLHQFVPLPGVTSVRIRITDESKKEMLRLTELYFFGEGEKPDWVQTWRAAEKADILLLSAHADDELLWFGGTLPYYAGERGLSVQVVYLAHGDTWRENELLDGLWMCGVKEYPVIGEFQALRTTNAGKVFAAWGGGRKTVFPWMTAIIRRYRPEIVLTHDLQGEYGHGVHQAAAMIAINCFDLAADESFDQESAGEYGVWQVKKLYIHMYRKNEIQMDWDQPLQAFGGLTGMEVADAALQCHKSQQPIGFTARWRMPYDCRAFGLYSTTVGPDEEKNDFMEHTESSDKGGRNADQR